MKAVTVQQGSAAPLPALSSHQPLSSPHSLPPSRLRGRVSGTVFSAIEMERGKLALDFKDVADKVGRQSGERQHGACVPRMLWGHRRAPDRRWGETGRSVEKGSP